jgi:alkanesulfonate monooxygenase SsuD/methylene tetrahydromethanopterin reductase-like flavin-dependent oxidoreductase (luciferase family)
VLGVPFRRSALVAKAAESLQWLSRGRFTLGLGVGYRDQEVRAVGGSAADIIEQLRAFTELGFTGFDLMPGRDQVRAVAEDIVPALRLRPIRRLGLRGVHRSFDLGSGCRLGSSATGDAGQEIQQ